jgi:uncharacterized membrane protein HdeD (DUF308 family)
MSTVIHPILDAFLLGFIAAISLVAALFFLRFWRETRDPLFLAFSLFFGLQAIMHGIVLDFARPNQGTPWLFVPRLLSIVVIVAAILGKNTRKRQGGH